MNRTRKDIESYKREAVEFRMGRRKEVKIKKNRGGSTSDRNAAGDQLWEL